MHDGGFTCAEVDAGTQHMAAAVSRLREERDAARDEVSRLLGELGQLRVKLQWLTDVRGWLRRNGARAFRTRQAYDALRALVGEAGS